MIAPTILHALLAGEEDASILIDRDPQQTSTKWWQRRQALQPAPGRPDLLDLDGTDLTAAAAALRKRPGAVFVDTRPAVAEPEAEAARVADLVIVPVRPSPDDLEAVGEFCRAHGIWFHADAAHGAPALLSPDHRQLLRGIESADSVVWDAHKMMRTSTLAAAVLVREDRRLEEAFRQKASYLIYEDSDEAAPSLLERQVECTKAPLGMRIFMNLAFRGEEGIGRHVAEQYEKTLRFWELISAREGFECLTRPESNILCFRYGRDPELQLRLRERLLHERRFHLSSAEVNGERWLRMTVMAPATTEETIAELIDAIERAASRTSGRRTARR